MGSMTLIRKYIWPGSNQFRGFLFLFLRVGKTISKILGCYPVVDPESRETHGADHEMQAKNACQNVTLS